MAAAAATVAGGVVRIGESVATDSTGALDSVRATYAIYQGRAIVGTVVDHGGAVRVRSGDPDLEPLVRRLLAGPVTERVGGVTDLGDGDFLCWDGIKVHRPGDAGHVAAVIGFGLQRYGYTGAAVE